MPMSLMARMAPVSCLLLMATQVREADVVGKGVNMVSGATQCPHSYLAITDTKAFGGVPIFTDVIVDDHNSLFHTVLHS